MKFYHRAVFIIAGVTFFLSGPMQQLPAQENENVFTPAPRQGGGRGPDFIEKIQENVGVGSKAQSWQVSDWLNSKSLKLEDLKGRVVLVRWWTAPECPFCRNSAPALNEFYEQYHDQGFEVIGLYHHKSLGSVRKKTIKKYADSFGFKFPVAIDHDWVTLKKWWLDKTERKWTSVSFLLDQEGIIRYIHPGGQYVQGDDDYAELKEMIEKLLEEKKPL